MRAIERVRRLKRSWIRNLPSVVRQLTALISSGKSGCFGAEREGGAGCRKRKWPGYVKISYFYSFPIYLHTFSRFEATYERN